jgi:hypothetical protein
MWDAKVYPLAILIVVFSGIWPYAKVGAMLFCWFSPTHWFGKGKRLVVLEFLDEWGKWSLIDGFVMVMFMVAFRFHLNVAEVSGIDIVAELFREANADLNIDVFVEAHLGFQLFLIATVGSLTVGHVMTACNRYALRLGEYHPSITSQDKTRKQRLCNINRPEGFLAGKLFAYVPVLVMGLCIALLLAGLNIECFAFKFEGLGGFVLGDERIRTYSVHQLAVDIPSGSRFPDHWGVIFMQTVFFIFAEVAVVAYFVILIVLWCAPLTTKMQCEFLVVAQTFSAWSGLEVCVVSILASVLEISQFAMFIVGDACNQINKILEDPRAPQLPGSQTCFGLKTDLRSGFFVLLSAGVVSFVMGRMMIGRCKRTLGLDVEHSDTGAVAA